MKKLTKNKVFRNSWKMSQANVVNRKSAAIIDANMVRAISNGIQI